MFTVSGRTFYDNLFLAAMKEQLKQEITKRRADDRKKSRREARMERQGSNKQQDKARKKSKGKGRDETEKPELEDNDGRGGQDGNIDDGGDSQTMDVDVLDGAGAGHLHQDTGERGMTKKERRQKRIQDSAHEWNVLDDPKDTTALGRLNAMFQVRISVMKHVADKPSTYNRQRLLERQRRTSRRPTP